MMESTATSTPPPIKTSESRDKLISSLKYTNMMLTVIAICLVALTYFVCMDTLSVEVDGYVDAYVDGNVDVDGYIDVSGSVETR